MLKPDQKHRNKSSAWDTWLILMYFHFAHLIYVHLLFGNCRFICSHVSVLMLACVQYVSAEPRARISWGLSAAVSRRIGPHSALSGGASTERLLDAKWTGNFSNLNTPPENSSCLFLTLIFPLMMCGQPANLSKNKSEWFRQLLLFHIV